MPPLGDVVNILPAGTLKDNLSLIEGEYVLEGMMQMQELPREERRARNKCPKNYKSGKSAQNYPRERNCVQRCQKCQNMLKSARNAQKC